MPLKCQSIIITVVLSLWNIIFVIDFIRDAATMTTDRIPLASRFAGIAASSTGRRRLLLARRGMTAVCHGVTTAGVRVMTFHIVITVIVVSSVLAGSNRMPAADARFGVVTSYIVIVTAVFVRDGMPAMFARRGVTTARFGVVTSDIIVVIIIVIGPTLLARYRAPAVRD